MYLFAVVASAILAAGLSNGTSAQTQATTEDADGINWRVVDRFRLFDRGDTAARERVPAPYVPMDWSEAADGCGTV